MIQRAVAILEALAGGPISNELMLRVAKSYLPEGVDPDTAANLQIATHFVRGVRRDVTRRARGAEVAEAQDTAGQVAAQTFDSEVGLGSD